MSGPASAQAPRWRISPRLPLLGVYLGLSLLLYIALRDAPLREIWNSLRQLRVWQIGLILLLNATVIVWMSLRWWVIVRAHHPRVPFLPLVGYRLSAFAVSYFTPGPQVGGEPMQVIYLHRNHGVTSARGTAAVIMDKLLETLSGFILLCLGLAATLRLGLLSNYGPVPRVAGLLLAAILLWPLLHLVLLYRSRHPISWVLRRARPVMGTPQWARLIIISEHMASAFTRQRLPWLLAALAFSVMALVGMGLEYFLIASFLDAQLSPAQTVAGLTAGVLAFLMPLPGGLGALEASQVLVLGVFGVPAPVAISITLLMRGRDLLNGGLGLLLAGRALKR